MKMNAQNGLSPAGEPEQFEVVILEGQPIRAWFEDGQPMWFAATEVGRAVGLGQSRMSQIAQELAEEDRGIRVANTPGGPQNIRTISRSGLYQVIAQLQDKELGRKLRKQLSDLGVAYETGKLALPPDPAADLRVARLMMEHANRLEERMLGMLPKLISETAAMLSGKRQASRRARATDPPLTKAEMARLKADGFTLAAIYLATKEQTNRLSHGRASGLTARCISAAEDYLPNAVAYRRYRDGSKTLTYIARDVLQVVDEREWYRGDPNPFDRGLFDAG